MRIRFIDERRWFAWRPVRTETGQWRWLTHVIQRSWDHRYGDYSSEVKTYALLP